MAIRARWNRSKAAATFGPMANFEDMFRRLQARLSWRDLDAVPDMRLDVTEDDKAFHVRAEVP